jgi:branched-chain amino acid transport system permease protein
MLRNNQILKIVLPLFGVIAVMVPFVIGEYYIDLVLTFLINLIVVVSFRLIYTTGGFNLAHIPLMGLGAYTSAILTKTVGWPFWLALPLAGISSALVGLMFSYLLTRTKGFAFFIASFGLGEAMRLTWTKLRVPFGGHDGIHLLPTPESFLGIDFSRAIPYYFLTLGVVGVCLLIMYRVEHSMIGDNFKAIRSKESLSKSVGINTTRYKMLAFTIGSFFAGIAGVLPTHYFRSVHPPSFGFVVTLYLIVWVIFGGLNTFAGPMLGLAVLSVAQELLRPLHEWLPLFYGAILIFTFIFLPRGLESIPKRVSMWWIRRSSSYIEEDQPAKSGSG